MEMVRAFESTQQGTQSSQMFYVSPGFASHMFLQETFWRGSIYQNGLVPGGRAYPRTDTHMVSAEVSETEIKSEFRNNATMILFIAGRESRSGVRWNRVLPFSKWGVSDCLRHLTHLLPRIQRHKHWRGV